MFGRTGAPQKGGPQVRECRTAARHFHGVMRHLTVHCVQQNIIWPGGGSVRRITKSELKDVTYSFPETKIYVRGPHFYQTGPNGV